jgi:acetyl-CoA carboxylase biotin carboxylase subunit
VTELETGVDLVRWQILIAAGEKLTLRQEDLRQRGHAIECRIYAEDPENNFLPSPGKILFLKEPQGPGVRYDGGIYGGWEVPIYYDPILAKLIVWAEDREMACRRMAAALDDFVILGIHTTIGFLKDIIHHPEFRAGRTNTAFIKNYFDGWKESGKNEDKLRLALAAAAFDDMAAATRPGGGPAREAKEDAAAPWKTLGRWRIGGAGSHGI